jgi:hypothetical protein
MNQYEEDEDMFAGLLKQFFKNAAVITAGMGIMLLASNAQAANCNITTSPDPAVITEGGTVTFNGSVSGKPPTSITSWDFPGGTPSSVSGDVPQVDVTYASATGSPFTATMNGLDGKGGTCSVQVSVTVNGGGGGNVPPVANDDSDTTTVDTAVTTNVVANDTDSDGTVVASSVVIVTPAGNGSAVSNGDGTVTYTPDPGWTGIDTYGYTVDDDQGATSNEATVTITVNDPNAAGPTARGDTYATPVGKTLDVVASRVSGVLYNDFGGTPPLTAELVSGPDNGTLQLNPDGSFTYTPNGDPITGLADNENDSFVYRAVDNLGVASADATANINILSDQTDFKIMMNYELGMHCTGFEFAYCCVLPPYNSILAQVVKPQATANTDSGDDFPRLLEGSHEMGLDGLGRPTVVRAGELDGSGNYKTYMLEYYHDAQPRREGQGKVQGPETVISAVEGNSLFYTSTIYDSAAPGPDNELVYGGYEGASDVVQGDGSFATPCSGGLPAGCTDNYANGWLNHFYIYVDPDTGGPNLEGHGATGLEPDKIRLGVAGQVQYPADVGAALQPMGPTGSAAGFDNVLTFSGDTGTVVYTQMKVLEDLPVMLTSPNIWEALGLPLTPFEDSINFFADPGLVDEDSIRPYVAMKARLHEASCDQDPASPNYGQCSQGAAVLGSNGHPVIGFGTAPIDIPNCERCHSVTDPAAPNSPSNIRTDATFAGGTLAAITDAEYQFWNAYYDIVPGTDSDWYSRLKGAAINMLALHDFDQLTGFTSNWPASTDTNPATNPNAQNTRLGKESVICQKCHADNVIAAVKSATKNGATIKPITEAIHWRHRETSEGGNIDFADAAGRSGGCQGCHPAHRSDGVMDGYPITLGGDNEQANSDNRLASGGCFVGRDVHSNPMKDVDGVETPAHLNAVGQWLADNVFHNQDGAAGIAGNDTRGLWCTNCHTQLGQEMWRAEDCNNLIEGDCLNNIRAGSLQDIADQVAGGDLNQVIAWLDPNNQDLHGTGFGDLTHAIWDGSIADANVATIEVSTTDTGCTPLAAVFNDAFGVYVCVTPDDVDPSLASVNILSFCTTTDCVDLINNNKGDQSQWRYPANPFKGANTVAAAVPFSAATDGRDHWLSPGEPHCADCHTAPFVEQSGNINAFPPFNYPAKASLMRYSRGHQDISCQGCHESIHGLYPVTPTIDTTSYAQAAALNHDGSHGPLKCGACHEVDSSGIPTWMRGVEYNGSRIRSFDDAVSWAHTFTREASVLTDGGACTNCHSYPKGKSGVIEEVNGGWLDHSFVGRVGRAVQSQAEIEALGHVAGDPDTDGDGEPDRTAQDIADSVCTACHSEKGGPSGAFLNLVTCDNATWKSHVFDGRLDPKVWEFVTHDQTSSSCGW